ncbi:Abi family protein, partial [Mycobacteroides abscessus]
MSMPTAPRPPKPFLSIADQITRLQGRGMAIDDLADARHRLESVGYYRLSGYWYPFRQRDNTDPSQVLDQFVPGTTFAEVAALYEFDRGLRAHLQVALERVEVVMRSQIGHRLGALDPLAHQDLQWFRPSFRHAAW